MKLSSLLAIAAVDLCTKAKGVTCASRSIVDRHVKSMANTRLFPGAYYGIVIDATEKSAVAVHVDTPSSEKDADDSHAHDRPSDLTNIPISSTRILRQRSDRYYGSAWIGNAFLREVQAFAGVSNPDLSSNDDAIHKIKMTHITKTSGWHVDGIAGQRYAESSFPVGFYVLNDNPHAHFEIMDDELCIPIVKGIFITFNGRKPHHTVIANGSVDLLGPFDLHGVKCVQQNQGTSNPQNLMYATYSYKAPVKSVKVPRMRFLNEEGGNEKTISGNAFRGVVVEPDNTFKIIGHKIAHNVTGLPQCSSCKMSIGLSASASAQECTAEAHKEASIIPLLNDLNYTSDDEGNTGVKSTDFIPDSEHPIGKQFLAEAEALNPFQNSSVSIFYYDNEGELIACSFLQRIISEEDKAMAAVILALTTAEHDHIKDSIFSEIEDDLDTLAAVEDGGNNADSTLLFSYLAIGMHAVCIMLLNLYG